MSDLGLQQQNKNDARYINVSLGFSVGKGLFFVKIFILYIHLISIWKINIKSPP